VFVDRKTLLGKIITSAVWICIIRPLPRTLTARPRHESENALTISTPVIL
jgi:hypothetical protein